MISSNVFNIIDEIINHNICLKYNKSFNKSKLAKLRAKFLTYE